jgi:hypothetical protein
MWHSDPAYQEWQKQQRERLNDLAKWTPPHGLRDLANEMADD